MKVFHCFACDAKGDVLTFVARLECLPVREAAAMVARNCSIPPGEKTSPPSGAPDHRVNSQDAKNTSGGISEGEGGNKVLSFALKLDGTHPYLAGRGLSRETIETFGLGYCTRGILKGRICIPIHDEKGNLVAVNSRAIVTP